MKEEEVVPGWSEFECGVWLNLNLNLEGRIGCWSF